MADIYWRTTKKVAPVLVTEGPGLLNCVGGVASAMHDMSAVMVIAGCGSTHFMGKGGMQEIYWKRLRGRDERLPPLTKGSWMLIRPRHRDRGSEPGVQARHLRAARPRLRPGAVRRPQLAEEKAQSSRHAGAGSPPAPTDAENMNRGRRAPGRGRAPVLLAGGGAAHSRGAPQRSVALAERLQIPVATTLTAKGLLDEDHPLSLGRLVDLELRPRPRRTRNADSCRRRRPLQRHHTSNWPSGKIYDVGSTKIVQVRPRHSRVARNYPSRWGIAGDACVFLSEGCSHRSTPPGITPHWILTQKAAADWAAWREEIQQLLTAETSPVHPARLCHEVGEAIAAVGGRVFIDIGDVVQYAEPLHDDPRAGPLAHQSGMAEMGWASSGVLGASRPTGAAGAGARRRRRRST